MAGESCASRVLEELSRLGEGSLGEVRFGFVGWVWLCCSRVSGVLVAV